MTQPPRADAPATVQPPKKKRRIFRWFFLAVNVVFLLWCIFGGKSGGDSAAKSCAGQIGQAYQTCLDASHVGTGIGIVLVIILWVVVDIILALIFIVMHLTRRSR